MVVQAIELYEFPKEIPIATRCEGSCSALIVGVIISRNGYFRSVEDYGKSCQKRLLVSVDGRRQDVD